MTRSAELADLERLLVDGNNLLHRLRAGVGGPAVRILAAQLRGRLPPTLETVLMLDGHAAPGVPRVQKLGPSLAVWHAGGSADEALLALVTSSDKAARWRTVVVTDDRALTERVRMAGGRTRRLEWLTALLDTPSGSRARLGRASRPPDASSPEAPHQTEDSEGERPAWRPGRGATVKHGNPKRRRRTR